ncbi:hypothetical protein OG407_41475 [Streptomyces sp. NBC_01515]|uniref:hypothetical protein n=1 Tax=Streptomyces sp. NBC_01515 TaxID=2903890 RepID=UPI00386F00B8
MRRKTCCRAAPRRAARRDGDACLYSGQTTARHSTHQTDLKQQLSLVLLGNLTSRYTTGSYGRLATDRQTCPCAPIAKARPSTGTGSRGREARPEPPRSACCGRT